MAPGSTIAVYDLGGGTFDAAVVRKADRSDAAFGGVGFGLLGRPEGLDRLGGVDFDEVVFEHVRDGLPAAFADLDDTDPRVLSAVARVRRECTEAKEALSADTDVSIPVLLPAASGSVRLHRSEFEGLIREQVEETVEALRKAVKSAGCAPEALTAVLLVGGSSRIPLVAQLVSDGLGRPVAVDTDPKNAIAKGAALSVSPKPTASWPEVAIPLVAAADQTTVVLPTEAQAEHAGKEAPKAAPAPVVAAALAPVAVRPPIRKPAVAGPVALLGADGGRHASGLADQPDAAPGRPVVPGGEAVEGWEPEEAHAQAGGPARRRRWAAGRRRDHPHRAAGAQAGRGDLARHRHRVRHERAHDVGDGTGRRPRSGSDGCGAQRPGVRARGPRVPSPPPALRRWPRTTTRPRCSTRPPPRSLRPRRPPCPQSSSRQPLRLLPPPRRPPRPPVRPPSARAHRLRSRPATAGQPG